MASTHQLTARVPGRRALPRGASRQRIFGGLVFILLAVIAYVPLLLTSPGMVGADTKQYLYLDPGRLIHEAASMWDPSVGMGTVTHQMIGYLMPMGPFYWFFAHIGAPVWVAQRLWLGSLLLGAGTGMLYLFRVLGVGGPGRLVGALAYMLSPYLLEYAARISAILMPWAALPWMLALVVLAVRRGGWRYPALFALVVALVGGVNATSLLYAGLAPVLWFPYVVWVTREASWRRALVTFAKTGFLTVLVSLWWIAGLAVEGTYDLNVLHYTETVKTVAKTSLASEVQRGLGYWYFYGEDKLGPWIQPAIDYTQKVWLIAVSYSIPLLGILAAFLARWRYRIYFVFLLLIGTVLAVGLYPYSSPSPLGSLVKPFVTTSSVGLAMRSTGRAVPLVILASAVLLGMGTSALARRFAKTGIFAAGVTGALVLANMYPLWAGTVIGGNLVRPSSVPGYWLSAANYVDSQAKNSAGAYNTRVLGIPGSDFASYRWGNTVDPIEPGLMTRPYVAREIFPYGTAGGVDLLNALDSTLQEGTFVPSSLAPVARLMSAGDVLLRSDLQYERYNTPRPRADWALLDPPPPGLSAPKGFGTPGPSNPVEFPMIDEIALSQAGHPYPPPVAVFAVPGARPIVRADPATRPLLVDGGGSGVVDAAPTGILNTNAAVIYTPSLAKDPSQIRKDAASGATLLLTDTNRKRGVRWGTIRENTGYTETASQKPTPDPTDQRLPLFPGAGTNANTVAEQQGVQSVTASSYGNPISYTPEDRPGNAFDGNLLTNWTTGDFSDPVGQWLQVSLLKPTTTDHVTLVQPINGSHNRFIKTATLSFDGHDPITVTMGPQSRQRSGQVVSFPTRTFRTLRITVDSTTAGNRASYTGLSGVGFAEVEIGQQHMTEVIRMPEDMLQATGQSSINNNLDILMTRQRAAPTPPRLDPEPFMARTFTLPTSRTFAITGTARISSVAPDNQVDLALGAPGANGSGVVATSSSRLTGVATARASETIDGNPATSWSPTFGPQVGQWLDYALPSPVTFDHMNLQVVADGKHSVPTQLRIDTSSGSRTVDLPPIADQVTPNATVTVPVSFPALTGSNVRVTITAVRPVQTLDYYSQGPIELPVGIAEIGIPGVSAAAAPAQLPATCRSDLISIDGKPVSVKISGSSSTAQALGGLSVTGCGPDARGIALGPGKHTVTTTSEYLANMDIDQLSLASAAGGGPLAPTPSEQVPAVTGGSTPQVHVVSQNRTNVSLTVKNPGHPFWLVLGESRDAGWTARLAGGRSLGSSKLIDGYANGWYVNPKGLPATIDVSLAFAPQSYVWAGLAASAAAVIGCLVLVLWPGRRWWARRRRRKSPGGRAAGEGRREVAGHSGAAAARYAAPDGRAGLPASPAPSLPFLSGGRRSGWGTALLAAAVTGLVSAAVFTPIAGPIVGAAVLAAARWDRARVLLLAGSVSLMGLAGLYVVVEQFRYRFPPEFEWPTFFSVGNTLAWFAVLFLLGDAVVELVRRRPWERWRAPPPQ